MPATTNCRSRAVNIYAFLRAVHSDAGPDDLRVREVLTQLALHRNQKTGQCNPGTRRLASQSTMSRNTVKAKLDAAVAAGWIRRTPRKTGGQSGAHVQYELVIPASVEALARDGERVSQLDPPPSKRRVTQAHPPAERSGSQRVTHPPPSERVNSSGQAGQNGPRSGSPQGWSRTDELVEQLAGAGLSTEERQRLAEADAGAHDAERAAKRIAQPNPTSLQRWTDWIRKEGEGGLRLAQGLRLEVDQGKTSWPRGELFATPEVFNQCPGLRGQTESAYWRHLEADGVRPGGGR